MTEFTQHNQKQAAVWEAFRKGKPTRVPMMIGCNHRMIVLDPALNRKGWSFEGCYHDPAMMYEVDLEFFLWQCHAIPCDMERGLPKEWSICPSFQTYYDAAWFGAPIVFPENEVPTTKPFLNNDNKRMLFDKGLPDPFSGIMGRSRDNLEYYRERASRERTFHGRPIKVANDSNGLGPGDGPFTSACNLRGATEFCMDLYDDPEYARELMGFIVEATIARQRAWRKYLGRPLIQESVFWGDDSIVILSCEAYREFVLPHHKKFMSMDVAPNATFGIHLCGDASRHFVTIRDELKVTSFDTGFPIDHGRIRQQLGPDITISGGVHVDLLLHGTPAQVAAETRRILHSGVMEGGKFILRDANNLAPCTPMANVQAMYDVCKKEGV